MNVKRSVSTRDIIASAATAETIVSDPAYLSAANAPFSNPQERITEDEMSAYATFRNNAQTIIFDAYAAYPHTEEAERNWQMQRAASLYKLGGNALGSFQKYFDGLNSAAPSTEGPDGLVLVGENGPKSTNDRIIRIKNAFEDPLEFSDAALGVIQQRRKSERDAVGPENYATTIKFFADKYANLDLTDTSIDAKDISKVVKQILNGFFAVAKSDMPNFVEMTNIYSAIKMLPAGSVDKQFTKPLLEYSFKMLPEYSDSVIATLLGTIPKLDLEEHGTSAAELVNLALRKGKQFETTTDFRVALRALAVLPKSDATDQSLKAFFVYRNDLEQSLTLEGVDEVMERFRTIANNVVGSTDLYRELKQIAERAARGASERTKRAIREGTYTNSQMSEVQVVFSRIMQNYGAI
jgi:hypothetical protein